MAIRNHLRHYNLDILYYAYFQEWGRLYFLTVFSKHDKPNLTGQERVELEKLVKRLEEALRLQ